MNKAVAAVGIALGLGAVGVVGASAWTGRTVSARLTQQTQEISKVFPSFKVVEEKVEHGLFGSTRNVTIQLGCLPTGIPGLAPGGSASAPEPIQFKWQDEIEHALWSGSLSTIESQLILPDKWQAHVKKLVGEQPLLQVKSVVAFGGEYTSDVLVPELKLTDPAQGTLVLSPIEARLKGKASGAANAATTDTPYTVDIPSIAMHTETQGEHFSFKATGIHSSVQLKASPEGTLWLRPSKSDGSVASLEIGAAVPAAGASGAPVKAVFENLKFASQTMLEKGLWTGTNSLSMKGRLNDFPIDKIEVESALRRVHAATYQELANRFFATVLSCDQAAQETALQKLLSDAQERLPELLLHDPEYALDRFALELSGQRAEFAYSVGTKGITKDDFNAPMVMLLLQKAVAKARAQIQMGLIERMMKAAMDTFAAPTAAPAVAANPGAGSAPVPGATANGADMVAVLVTPMIDKMSELGYVVREGDLIKSSAAYEGGQLSVNGKVIDLSSLGELPDL